MRQKDLAQRLGVSDEMVSQWMSGRRYPSFARLHDIADALGVMVSELFTQPPRNTK